MRKFGNIIKVYSIYLLIFKRHMTVCRDMLWKCMEEFKIPKKLINMCKTYVPKTRSSVSIGGTLSSFFENKTGLKVGDYHQYYSL